MRVRVIVVVVAVLTVAATVSVLVARPWAASGGEDPLAAPVRAELSARVVTVLEDDPAGRQVVTRGTEPVACAARAIGVDPPGATGAAQARTVYAWAVCWTIVGGAPRTGVSVPLAVRLGPPVAVDLPTDGAGYSASVKRIFPARLHDTVFDNNRYAVDVGPQAQQRASEVAARR